MTARNVAAARDLEGELLERIAPLIIAQFEERLAAYAAGHEAGFLAGYEQCARERLADVRLAMGEAA